MNALTVILAVTMLAGCSPKYYVAGAIFDRETGRPEFMHDNPVCIIGAEKETHPGFVTFAEHHSSCFHREAGEGYNLVGFKYYFEVE